MRKMRQIQPEYIMPTNIDGNTEKNIFVRMLTASKKENVTTPHPWQRQDPDHITARKGEQKERRQKTKPDKRSPKDQWKSNLASLFNFDLVLVTNAKNIH